MFIVNRRLYFFAIVIFVLFIPNIINSQVKIGDSPIGSPTPDPSAILELESLNKGFLPPRFSTGTRANIVPKEGMVIFNTDDQCLNIYQNGFWSTYCNFRFNYGCNCIEYLANYGLPGQAWTQVPSSTDADWILDGSTSTPSDNTDDIHTLGRVTIGQSAAPETANLNIVNDATSGNTKGIYNSFDSPVSIGKAALHNEFKANTLGTLDGVFNEFSSTSTNSKYGFRNLFDPTSSGTAYGLRNDFDSNSSSSKYGVFNDFSVNAAGTKYGIRNYFPSTTATGTIYGMYNAIYNDGSSSKYGVHNLLSGIEDGAAYGSYNRITMNTQNTDNAYGVYSYVTNNGTGTSYGGYHRADGVGNMGLYAQNTSNGGRAAGLNGDVEIGNGWLMVGDDAIWSNTDNNSITRYGTWEGSFVTNIAIDHDGYLYYNIGNIDLPGSLTSVTVNKIEWEIDGHHGDRDEAHGFWVALENTTYTGVTGWHGWISNLISGAGDVNWQYVSSPITKTISDNQNIRVRVEDEDCTFCGSDEMRVFNVRVKLHYSYVRSLEEGEIVASGLIYSNASSQVGDLAEHFEVNDQYGIEYGMVVGFKPGTDNEYELITKAYSPHIVGVISENPSMVLNDPRVGPAVALAGRVKVKLIDSDHLIQSGQFLTTSTIAGKAQKATRSGRVIGYAVSNQKEGEDFVDILIQPGYHSIE